MLILVTLNGMFCSVVLGETDTKIKALQSQLNFQMSKLQQQQAELLEARKKAATCSNVAASSGDQTVDQNAIETLNKKNRALKDRVSLHQNFLSLIQCQHPSLFNENKFDSMGKY